MTTLIGLDPVTVGASDLTQGDLDFGLSDALGCADVPILEVADVIEVKRNRARVVSAVHTPRAELEGIEPSPSGCRSIVGLRVHSLAVSGSAESRLTPFLRLHGVVLTRVTRSIATAIRAIQRAISLRLKGPSTDNASTIGFRRVLPGRHDSMIPATDDIYPIKPDIFEATYEPV
jgi:hypothetical protein